MLADSYKNDGAVLAESFGVRYPEAFTHPMAEYRALTSTAALIDLCHWSVLRLTGEDHLRLLNSLTTNDAASLDVGEACRSAITTIKGKLVAELVVLRRDAEILVLVAQGNRGAVTEVIEKHIVTDDVNCEDVSDEYGVLSMEGPKARGIVWRLFPEQTLPTQEFRFVDYARGSCPVTILNNSVSGEHGYQLVVPVDAIRRIRDHLVQSGWADDATPAGRAAWNMRRVEAGLPWWGADVAPGENFPKESRLDDVVSYDKGCFLGQETLARMHHRGHPNWLLVGLAPEGEIAGLENPEFLREKSKVPPNADVGSVEKALAALDTAAVVPAGTGLFAANDSSKSAGRITSSAFSPKLQKPLFLGYVRAALADPGTGLLLRTNGGESTLTVTPLPTD